MNINHSICSSNTNLNKIRTNITYLRVWCSYLTSIQAKLPMAAVLNSVLWKTSIPYLVFRTCIFSHEAETTLMKSVPTSQSCKILTEQLILIYRDSYYDVICTPGTSCFPTNNIKIEQHYMTNQDILLSGIHRWLRHCPILDLKLINKDPHHLSTLPCEKFD